MPPELAALSLTSLLLVVFAFFFTITLVAVVVGFASERAFPERKIIDVPLFPGQYAFELQGNVVFLVVVTLSVTFALRGEWVQFSSASTLRSTATFFAMLYGFQVFYWFLHRAMHTKSLVFIHRWHHRSQVTTPLTGQSMHPVEAALWMLGYVGLAVLLSRVMPFTFWGWVGYLGFNVFGNQFGHSNIEATVPSGATRTASLFANAFVFHSLHHARWTGHYGFQGAGMDRLMGTEWNDWPALYARINAGQPMRSLKERGDDAS